METYYLIKKRLLIVKGYLFLYNFAYLKSKQSKRHQIKKDNWNVVYKKILFKDI